MFPIETTHEKTFFKLFDADHLDFINDEKSKVWFGDPSSIFSDAEWFDMGAAMAHYMRQGFSGGGILIGGMQGLWQATATEPDFDGMMLSVDYPGGVQSIRVKSSVLMLLPLDVAEFYGNPLPGIVTKPFFGRVYIDHDDRSWSGSNDVSA